MATACSIVMANDRSLIGGVGGNGQAIGGHATSCLLMSVTVVCICVLVVCGVLVVREYTLAETYEATLCQLANITYGKTDISCMHCAGTRGEKAKDKGACVQTQFPCVHIFVVYHVNETGRRAQLHQDSIQAAGAYSQVGL